MIVELQKFNMEQLHFAQGTKPLSIGIFGACKSGKTTLVRNLLRLNSDVTASNCHVFTCLDPVGAIHGYADLIPADHIHGDDDGAETAELLRRQTALVQMATQQQNEVDARAVLVLDNYLFILHPKFYGDSDDENDEEVNAQKEGDNIPNKHLIYWAINARHFQTMPVVSSQSVAFVPSVVCNNFDYVFLARENIVPNLKQMYDLFGGMFPTYKTFFETLCHYTNDHQWLVIRLNAQTASNFEDLVFWYKTDV